MPRVQDRDAEQIEILDVSSDQGCFRLAWISALSLISARTPASGPSHDLQSPSTIEC
jgi:hypothetical protein